MKYQLKIVCLKRILAKVLETQKKKLFQQLKPFIQFIQFIQIKLKNFMKEKTSQNNFGFLLIQTFVN